MSFKALTDNYAYNIIGIRGSCIGKYFIILIDNGLIKLCEENVIKETKVVFYEDYFFSNNNS
jgi:hypothetical protein